MKKQPPNVVVVGAGIGGLTTAAMLSRAGLPVTVLEAHIYPGGCAGTFFHQGFRFDAGATLAGGFYPGGPMDLIARETGIQSWPARATDAVMSVHLPNGTTVTRYGDERRWQQRTDAFGEESLPFWRWQERTADLLWNLALRSPTWPPQDRHELRSLARTGLQWATSRPLSTWHPSLALDVVRALASRWPDMPDCLRLFVDAQLLIAAQATSRHTNALYGASALDLPRRGVAHLAGGMGGLAKALSEAIKINGGHVHYRQRVSQIVLEGGHPKAVVTNRGDVFDADIIVANLPPYNIAALLGDNAPAKLRKAAPYPQDGWGAFTVYAGVDSAAFADDQPLHHQLVRREPMGEGNTLFLSISPSWDQGRAPAGQRAVTMSTHTRLGPWWEAFHLDRAGYEERKQRLMQRMLESAECLYPGLTDATSLMLPGTPVTFQRFTSRHAGWVGGFPQRHLFRTWGPKLGPALWMVGDSIFPGQSTAAVALGGRRVAHSILATLQVVPQRTGDDMAIPTEELYEAAS